SPCPSYANLRNAAARNHPFKNWADFVAFLGQLVYRSPMPVNTTVAANNHAYWLANNLRDPILGVKASLVCTAAFFDGSSIANADSLQGQGGVGGQIVAVTGYWPISANYGAYPQGNGGAITTPEAMLYPPMPANLCGSQAEWQRRVDEWRGRDAAGLRVEQNYISEAAANDILVSLSNGLIGPIDFDGDGHVTMTRKDEIPLDRDYNGQQVDYWKTNPTLNPLPGYPWHNLTGSTAAGACKGVESQWKPGFINTAGVYNYAPGNDGYNDFTSNPNGYGIKTKDPSPSSVTYNWNPVDKSQVIQGCVTLPIKFRANTF